MSSEEEKKLREFQEMDEYAGRTDQTGADKEDMPKKSGDAADATDGGLYRDPDKPAIVGVQMFFSRTGELDMIQQNFYTQFDLVMEWPPTKEEVESYIKDPKGFMPSWIPIVQFKNGSISVQNIKIVKENQGFRVIGPKCESTDVYGNNLNNLRYPYIIECMYDVQGTFSEFLELHNFPMDCQDLKISMQLMDSMLKATFAPYLNAKAEVVQVALKYNGLEEYDMVPPVVEFYANQYSEAFSALNVILKLRRKYHIYFWKIVLFVGLICLSSLASYTMHHIDDLPDRYGLLFTLLLTQVAFQYVVSESLPQLTYLTLLDVYVLAGFVYLIIQIVGVGVIAFWELSESSDVWFGYFSILLFTAFQVGFMLWAYRARQYELRKLTFTSNDYMVNNYLMYHNLQSRSKVYGITPDKLSLTKKAKSLLTGERWSDLAEGVDDM